MHYNPKNRIKLYRLIFLMLCLIIILTAIPLYPMVFATPSTAIPIVQDALTTDTTKPVVLIKGSSQTGYETLAQAMAAIGSNDGDYIIVFVQNYNMVLNTDMNATNANATGNNVSLSITSSFISDAPSSVKQTKIFSMQGSNTSGYNAYFNADTTIHDMVFDVYGTTCSHMFGKGHNFTIGDNVVVNNKGSNGRIQLYGGGDAALGSASDPSTTNLVINSGTFAYAMAANRNGVFTGDAKITVQGTALVTNLYAGSQSAALGANSTSTIIADGTDGAAFSTIAASMSTIPASASVTLKLKNAKNFGVVDLNTRNSGTSNVLVQGDFVQIHTRLLAGDLKIDNGTTLRLGSDITGANSGTTASYGGALTLKGDLTLGTNSTYIHAGISAQSIGGDLIVNGDGSEIQLYKTNAATAPVKMTIAGEYANSSKTVDLSLWKNVAAADKDVLLTFSSASNADGDNYNRYRSTPVPAMFETEASGANIIYSLEYEYPTYYELVSGNEFYCYTEVGESTDSDGGSKTVYRKYVYNNTSGIWEVFNSDKNGNISGSPLDQSKDRPQPNSEHLANFESSKGVMIRLDAFGKYRLTAAVGTNASGSSSVSTGTACGNHASFYNIDNKGTNSLTTDYESNASWADLKKSNNNCVIHKAYLIMTTTLRANSGTLEEQLKSNLINHPMKLMYGDDVMLSNGYLPEGFVIGKEGSNDASLSSDNPSLLYDNIGPSRNLGEAMTITDVTDFVKEHGYGRYYGVDIPYEGVDVDAAIAWRLVVLEEDDTMEYIRKVSLQIGPISNGNLADNAPATVTLDLDGLTTPDVIDGDTFGGQLLVIGSDNTTDPRAGGGTGSNLHNTFYPDPTKRPTEAIQVASNDPSTPLIDRPLGYWSQGLMDINGVNLTIDQVSHVEESNGAMGIDMSLLDITNVENEDWETIGGHNLYLTPSSPSIKLTSRNDGTKIGYIDFLGISTDVALPKFDTEIWHTDICTIPAIGTDIIAGQPVIVKGKAINITPTISVVQGSFNTQVIVNIDEKLTGIRDLNDENPNTVTAKFHNYNPDDETYTIESVVGVYDSENNAITFDFGTEFLNIPLYNTKNDWIEFEFKADTQPTPTIDNPDVQYDNNIGVWGQTIYQNSEVIQTPYARYDYDEDHFNTYLNQVQISKVVTGDYADSDQEFTFTATLSNSVGGHFPEGTKIKYTGGVLDGITAEKPDNGTLTVDSNGSVTFTLKHGQYVNFLDILGTIEVSETSVTGYHMSWENVLLTGDNAGKTQNVGYDNTTGPVEIGENESRQINIYNDKSRVPPTGITLPGILPYLVVVLLCIGGCILIFVLNRRKKKSSDQ